MEQIQNVGQVSFQANTMPTKQAEQTPAQATTNPIENGDEKSMDALKWAGIIGAATLAAGAITYSVIRGKGIDSKYVKFDKAGKATYQKAADGSELGKITKWIKGIDEAGNIKSGKVVRYAEDGSKNLVTKLKDGKRISQKVLKDGKTIKFEYNADNKLVKTVKDGITTTFEYSTDEATKGKLVKKTVGEKVYEFKYGESGKISEVLIDGKTDKQLVYNGEKLSMINQQDKTHTFYYDESDKLEAKSTTRKDNGKLISKQVFHRDDKGNIVSSYRRKIDAGVDHTSMKIGTEQLDIEVTKKDGKRVSHKASFGDNSVESRYITDEKFEPITVNGEKVENSQNKKWFELIGLDADKYDAFCKTMLS